VRGALAGKIGFRESVRCRLSTTRRTWGVHSRPRPLGPNGEKLCYNCGGLLPKGRPYNCSHECSEEWRAKTSPSYMRYLLFKRDRGVCAICGADTVAQYEEYRKIPHDAFENRKAGTDARSQFRKAHGIPPSRSCGDWWDADHIVPVIEGGGECGLSNFRTLCISCHRKETKQLHGRLAVERKKERVVKKDESRPLFAALGE
jgi:5-methylcytosine-specific restriction protein A